MKAGLLRHRILFQVKELVQDSETGAVSYQWVDYARRWAKFEPLSAREFVAGLVIQSEVKARVTIRFMPDLDPEMRIVHHNKFYNIVGGLPDAKSGFEYITIPVTEGVKDG